jgi:hypothetical protein
MRGCITMDRRGFLKVLAGTAAAAIVAPEIVRTYFLPPRFVGWPHPRLAMSQYIITEEDVADNLYAFSTENMRYKARERFSNGWTDPRGCFGMAPAKAEGSFVRYDDHPFLAVGKEGTVEFDERGCRPYRHRDGVALNSAPHPEGPMGTRTLELSEKAVEDLCLELRENPRAVALKPPLRFVVDRALDRDAWYLRTDLGIEESFKKVMRTKVRLFT